MQRLLREYVRMVLRENASGERYVRAPKSRGSINTEPVTDLEMHDDPDTPENESMPDHLRDPDAEDPVHDTFGPVPPSSDPVFIELDPYSRYYSPH